MLAIALNAHLKLSCDMYSVGNGSRRVEGIINLKLQADINAPIDIEYGG